MVFFITGDVFSDQWKSVNQESCDMGNDDVKNEDCDHEGVSCWRKTACHVEKEEYPH